MAASRQECRQYFSWTAAGAAERLFTEVPRFMQLLSIRRIYWREAQNAKEDTMVRVFANDIPGDVDDLIFQDCWLVSDR